jgi:hypothetical protein
MKKVEIGHSKRASNHIVPEVATTWAKACTKLNQALTAP